ncbi:MAG: metallophosphoesterase [Halioglobus sp.]|nr:metallophosphoesterase [Halioglobus sp.]
MAQQFAQLSDPHLTSLANVRLPDLLSKRALGYLSWRRKRRHEHRREVLDALQRDLAHEPVEQILITGDLTHIGLPEEFKEARDWLRQLGTPDQIALVPGNHDACVDAPWDATYALWREYMAPDADSGVAGSSAEFPTLRVRGEIAFIGLSTAVPTPPLLATGTAGREQLERLAALLRDTARRSLFRVIYLHHCPLARHEKWRKRLTDAPALEAVLKEYGAELVVHGHGHRSHYRTLATRDGVAPVIAVPSASALGRYGAHRASYNRYAVQRNPRGWILEIDSRRYNDARGEFEAVESSRFDMER